MLKDNQAPTEGDVYSQAAHHGDALRNLIEIAKERQRREFVILLVCNRNHSAVMT